MGTVLPCRDLAPKDRNGASDPFVRVRYNGRTQETSVRRLGGRERAGGLRGPPRPSLPHPFSPSPGRSSEVCSLSEEAQGGRAASPRVCSGSRLSGASSYGLCCLSLLALVGRDSLPTSGLICQVQPLPTLLFSQLWKQPRWGAQPWWGGC